MNPSRWLPMAALLLAFHAHAERPQQCPTLPAGTDLSWDVVEGPDFLYCKAMQGDAHRQAFAVTLREDPTFRPERGLREEKAVIDGREVRWYRGDLATQTNVIVRETLVELDNKMTAHIVLRAQDEAQREQSQRLAEALRFSDLRVGSN